MAKLRYQNSFSAGDSLDSFIGASNQVYKSKSIDFRTNQKGCRLALLPQSFFGFTGSATSKIGNKIISVNGYIITFTNDGTIYRDNSTTPIYTDVGAIKNACIFDDRLYWITGNKLNNISISNVGGTWDGTTVNVAPYGQQSLPNTSRFTPMKVFYNNKMFIGNGLNIITVNTGGSAIITETFKVFRQDEITCFTVNGNYLKTYTACKDYVGNYYTGRLYYWDTSSTNQTDLVELKGLPVRNAIEFGNTDYMIAGIDDSTRPYFTVGLYLQSGRDYQLIRQFSPDYTETYWNYIDTTKFGGQPYPLLLDGNILYIGSYSGIYSYGTNKPGYPKTWTLEFRANNSAGDFLPNLIIGDISIVSGNSNIIYSWGKRNNDTTLDFGVDSVDVSKPYTYVSIGQFDTLPIYLGLVGVNKGNIEMYIGHSILNAGEKIEIYSSLNGGSYSLIRTIAYSNSDDVGQLRTVVPITGDWNYIKFRINIYSGTSGLTTPELYDMALFYDDNIKY